MKVLDGFSNVHHFVCQYEYVNLSYGSVESTFFALFWSQIPQKNTKIRKPSNKEGSGHKITPFSSIWDVVI
jgi:hypothetical protein